MSHRPYPSRTRALHQVDRHAWEYRPGAPARDRMRATICRAFGTPPRVLGLPYASPYDG